MERFFRKAYTYLKLMVLTIILLIAIYVIFSIVFSLIPVNQDVDSKNGIEIYIKTNGVHLDIVLPLKNEIKDWTTDVWIHHDIVHSVKLISFGLGDKDFYKKTPEWSDLSLKTTLKAMFLKSSSAIHVNYYVKLETDATCRLISVNTEQFKRLVDFIEKSFQRNKQGNLVQIQDFQYHAYDCFYEATPPFNLFFTCNTWTNKCLKKAGIKACLWTPYDKGTLYQYRQMEYSKK